MEALWLGIGLGDEAVDGFLERDRQMRCTELTLMPMAFAVMTRTCRNRRE
jgi:hypothetical protein